MIRYVVALSCVAVCTFLGVFRVRSIQCVGLSCPPVIVPSKLPKSYLAVCAILRDELDVCEWIEYHRRVGVEMFYIYDHGSAKTLADYVYNASTVAGDIRYEYFNKSRQRYPQLSVYNKCVKEFARYHNWIAFIDLDEFLVPLGESFKTVPDILYSYEEFGGLAINWQLIGSSNHTRRPAGGIVSNYITCIPVDHAYNRMVKVIVNTRYVKSIISPHHASYNSNKHAVTENRKVVRKKQSSKVHAMKLVIYHYVLKSKEDFAMKVKRGGGNGHKRPLDYLDRIDKEATALCFAAQNISKLKLKQCNTRTACSN